MKNDLTTDELLTRRVSQILPSRQGLKSLMGKKKLRLYFGVDPTATRLHLGHTVGIRKLMDFANAGHEAILLFGTGTVLVGDPSQRDTGRKLVTQEEIEKNIKTWRQQIKPVVDFEKVEIKKNGDWLLGLTLKEIVEIASQISAIQLFKREMFQRRLKQGETVWFHETMYPLLQGYDSVAMDVDLEIGGTDQEFNMLIGRELQRKMNSREKFVLTTPMILGTDGQEMSKTSGNCIWLDDSAEDMFGKLMNIPDEQIRSYMELVTDIPLSRIKEGEQSNLHPMEAKKELAVAVVTDFHGDGAAQKAREHFEKTFQQRKPGYNLKIPYRHTLVGAVAEIAGSKSEAKRLIRQGAVDVSGVTIYDPNKRIEGGEKLKIGKKTFAKILPE